MPIKHQRLPEGNRKHDPTTYSYIYMCIRDTLQIQRQKQVENKMNKKNAIQTVNKRKVEWIYQNQKSDFKTKIFNRDKGRFVIIKEAIHQKDITIANIYATNKPQYLKKKLTGLKGKNRQLNENCR